MKTLHASLLLLCTTLFAFSCNAPGLRPAGEEHVLLPASEVHEGWYFAAGRQVLLHGAVNGDAYIAGGDVEIDGTINGMLVVAGGQVNVSGTVTDRILAAGGTVRLTGKTAKSITAAGGTVILGREATVGENLLLAGNTLQVNGSVEHEAKTAGGEVQLSGTIKGNLAVAAGRFNAFQGALVGGDLSVETDDSTNVRIEPGTVHGNVHIVMGKKEREAQILGVGAAAFWFRILFGLTLLLTALVLSFLTPRYLARTGRQFIDQPGQSMLWGIIVLIVAPVVALGLCITIIGLPLGLFLFFLYLWFLYLSQLALGATIGSRLYGLTGRRGWALFGPVALGLIIIQVLTLIPIVRILVVIAGLIIGVGALAMALYEEAKVSRIPARPAGT